VDGSDWNVQKLEHIFDDFDVKDIQSVVLGGVGTED
jgi:hypothetical protein